MEISTFFHPTTETIISVGFSLGLAFIGHKASIAAIFRRSSEALTHLADYVDTSNPEALKAAMVDASNSIDLVKSLDIAVKYSGVKTNPKPQPEPSINPVPVK